MASKAERSAIKIALRIPVIVLVLAATAIPIELRPLGSEPLDFKAYGYDFAQNVAGYVAVGIVLAEWGLLRGVIAAALMSTVAETGQFVMMHRDPSAMDIVANVIGGAVGVLIGTRWKIPSPELRVTQGIAAIAAVSAIVIVLVLRVRSGDAINERGISSPGVLEAQWQLDSNRGRVALDATGHGLNGKFRNEPKLVPDVSGSAVLFNGKTDYLNLGSPSELRLAGGMTISAWINSSSYPVDDAAIVSQLNADSSDQSGYQLDTTVDRGPRTIGFKLADACDKLMARYGATPLITGKLYHVAGVYDAEAKQMDVYLNGKLDNGVLLGSVTNTQHSSRSPVYVGRRSDSEGFEFAGAIRDVRIYSFALTSAQIAEVMHGGGTGSVGPAPAKTDNLNQRRLSAPCAVLSDHEDARIPGAAATFGVLAAIAFLGFRPSGSLRLCLGVSLAAGFLLVPAVASTLPSITRWTMPLTSLAGGASVAVSVRRRNADA